MTDGTKSSVNFDIFEKMDFQLEHLEMEFEAETWWFWSTHEGYKTTKFQLQTPSLSVPTGNPFFKYVKIDTTFGTHQHLSGLRYHQIR